MFYKWLRIKVVLSEVFDFDCGVKRSTSLLYNKDKELAEAFEFIATCHGEEEFQKGADRWHSALFRWIDKEYGPRAAQLENQIDQILQGNRVHIV